VKNSYWVDDTNQRKKYRKGKKKKITNEAIKETRKKKEEGKSNHREIGEIDKVKKQRYYVISMKSH